MKFWRAPLSARALLYWGASAMYFLSGFVDRPADGGLWIVDGPADGDLRVIDGSADGGLRTVDEPADGDLRCLT